MKKKSTYNKKRKTYKPKRKFYKKRRPDKGTFLKITGPSLPVIINNKSSPQSGSYTLTDDTYQARINFKLGNVSTDTSVILNNEQESLNRPFTENTISLGLPGTDWIDYQNLYKYYQVYKIVVKFYPTVTEGGTLTQGVDQTTGQFSNAISGLVTTDVARDRDYFQIYPGGLEGQSRAMSRKVSRNHNLLKPWTRTFVPSIPIEAQGNPRAEFQYRPKYLAETGNLDTGTQDFIMRMRKPQIAGFVASSEAGTAISYPPLDQYVRFGTMQVTGYIKYIQPYN